MSVKKLECLASQLGIHVCFSTFQPRQVPSFVVLRVQERVTLFLVYLRTVLWNQMSTRSRVLLLGCCSITILSRPMSEEHRAKLHILLRIPVWEFGFSVLRQTLRPLRWYQSSIIYHFIDHEITAYLRRIERPNRATENQSKQSEHQENVGSYGGQYWRRSNAALFTRYQSHFTRIAYGTAADERNIRLCRIQEKGHEFWDDSTAACSLESAFGYVRKLHAEIADRDICWSKV